jgi:hypothetical protein
VYPAANVAVDAPLVVKYVAVEVKFTVAPLQTDVGVALALAVGDSFMTMAMAILVADAGETQARLEVKITLIKSPLIKSVPDSAVYVAEVAPTMLLPFFVH